MATKSGSTSTEGVEFNFCQPLYGSGPVCTGSFYSGYWKTNDAGSKYCEEALSGSTLFPYDSMKVEAIKDDDGIT